MAVKLIFGGLAEPKADVLLTFRPGGTQLGLDVPLTAEARALIVSIFAAEGYQYLPGPTLSTIRVCPAPWCVLWSFTDFSQPPSELEPGVYSYRAPLADPLGLIVAAALAYWAEDAGVKAVVEAYSDVWPRHCAALNTLRGLEMQVVIYTGYYDPRYACYDELDVRYIPVDITQLRQPRVTMNQARFAAPQVVEPQLDRDVLDLVRQVWEAGGFLSLKAAREWYGSDVVRKALAMGLLVYSRLDMTLRVTESGAAMLQTYGTVEEETSKTDKYNEEKEENNEDGKEERKEMEKEE